MTLDLEAVHRAAADIIRDGLGDVFTVSPCPDTQPAPVIEVWPGDEWVTYQATQHPEANATLRIRIEAHMGDNETGFMAMTRALSPSSNVSIWALLEDDTTLRGTVAALETHGARWEPDPETKTQIAWVDVEVYE